MFDYIESDFYDMELKTIKKIRGMLYGIMEVLKNILFKIYPKIILRKGNYLNIPYHTLYRKWENSLEQHFLNKGLFSKLSK